MKFRTKWRLDDGQIEVVTPALAAVLRTKTPAERIAMVSAANKTARLRLEGHLRSRHPTWPDARITREVAERMAHGAG